MVILKRETGGLEPRVQGNGGGPWQAGPSAGLDRGADDGQARLTLDDLVLEIADAHNTDDCPSRVGLADPSAVSG